MKFINALVLCLPAVSAIPQGLPPAGKGIEIRDESRLEELRQLHAQTIKGLKVDGLEKRQGAVASKAVRGVAGLFLVSLKSLENKTLTKIADKALRYMGADNQEMIWHNHDHCRTYFETQGGGNCETRTYDRGATDRTGYHKDNACSWIDPPNNDPPVIFYEGDQGIGTYSIQYTATKEHAWDGIPGTETCSVEGICNPQFVFYRENYNIVLNTWQSQGEVSYCQYSGGGDCRGLCYSGVMDQFTSGGIKWGGSCAMPCAGEANLPAIEKEVMGGIMNY
ncbi:hypothetical protein FZEAL_7560 [Fusarium zealandicum]|uniref:Uncharacterized protein n=1 Tax=Fusarium zealandicum TaxID=1053134 RepID=A0A8H4UFQ5_9HYPO|nr:hypothetical protein FZEAL_7560 [Fusarium zealandicum]